MADKPLWFGGILTWRRSSDGWEARHGGKLHEIVKLSRRGADEQRTSPGWHLVHHEPGAAWCGPGLGGTRDYALVMAEAHILVPHREWFASDDAPGFTSAMSGGGAAWGTRPFTAWPDHERRCITARAGDDVVGEVAPEFALEADPAVEPVHLVWTPTLRSGRILQASASWRAACASLADAVEDLGGNGRGAGPDDQR